MTTIIPPFSKDLKDFDGRPQLAELYKFKIPGHFSDFSKQKYEKWLTEDLHFAKN